MAAWLKTGWLVGWLAGGLVGGLTVYNSYFFRTEFGSNYLMTVPDSGAA